MASVGVILKIANRRNETPEEFVTKLRSGSEQDIQDFRVINAHDLAEADKIALCGHYPLSVFRPPTSALSKED